jgi:uncharacterized protein (DUF2236 family)
VGACFRLFMPGQTVSSVAHRINAERVVLLGWSRAILLQLAHPLVAAGVAEHSTFRAGRLAAAIRLHHTVRAMGRLSFGSPVEQQAALDGIRAIHQRVHGTLRHATGPFPAGTSYSAEDPTLVCWVHVTLVESLPLVYQRCVAPLSAADLDAWCRDSAPVARALGAGPDVPETWPALQDYVRTMHQSGALVVGPDARALASAVLAPPLGLLVAPARRINRLVTTALLPESIRTQYGLAWRASDARAADRWMRTIRVLRQVAPRAVREWPEARRTVD